MKEWWMNLQKREQNLVATLGVFCVIFLIYQLIFQPLTNGIDKAEKKLARQQALLSWVSEETARYRQFQSNGNASQSSDSLSSVVNSTAQRHQITIARLQPKNNDVQIWVDNVNFDSLLAWLTTLSTEHNLQVKAIDLGHGNSAGQVKIKRLQLGK